jgi:hypothetical protein
MTQVWVANIQLQQVCFTFDLSAWYTLPIHHEKVAQKGNVVHF